MMSKTSMMSAMGMMFGDAITEPACNLKRAMGVHFRCGAQPRRSQVRDVTECDLGTVPP
jgi:hypothetical protein